MDKKQAPFIQEGLTLKGIHEQIEANEYRQCIQVLGIYNDEKQYLNELFDLSNSIRVQVFEDVLDKKIDNQKFQKIEQLLQIIKENPQLSIKRIVAFMQGFELIISVAQLEAYVKWLTALVAKQEETLKINESFRRIFTDCIKWSFTYLQKDIDLEASQRKVQIWYKSVSPTLSQEWFMSLSKALGYSILYIDVSKSHASMWLPKKEWSKSSVPIPLPITKFEVISTLARNASLEFNELMNQADKSGQATALFFKPYQFKEASLKVVPLRTTYDELKILGTSEAYLRPGFQVVGNELKLPVLFAKVNGVLENEKTYWAQLEALQAIEVRHQAALSSTTQEKARTYALYHEFVRGPDFTPDGMIEREEWPYEQLSTGAQLMLAGAIIEAIQSPKVELKPHEKIEIFQTYTYEVLLQLPKALIQVFHQFDYPKQVPKLLWFDHPEETMTREDALQLLLFHNIGFDCLIYSPNGLNSIENHLAGFVIDYFWLDQMKELTLENKINKKGFLKRLFGDG